MSHTPAIKRVVEISKQSYLKVRDAQLVVEQNGELVGSIPAEDLGVLLLDSPAIVLTTAVLKTCFENHAAVVVCDSRHLPGAMLVPLQGYSLASAVLADQIAATPALKSRLWKQIVASKILAQARVLKMQGMGTALLERLAKNVSRGDRRNAEAQAARFYWPRLFGQEFRRDPDRDGVNALLNYGYAVVRAVIARSICAAGLNPSLGLKHQNQYNGLCLADDLMEPLRPLVDLTVKRLMDEGSMEMELNRDTKRPLLDVVGHSVEVNGQPKPLAVACHEYSVSLRRAFAGETPQLSLPVI